MAIRLGINGFGRIGRMVFRSIAKEFHDIEVVAVNDLLDADHLAYLLKYDSVHGTFAGEVGTQDGDLMVDGKRIRLTGERDPAKLKWDEVGVDLVVECTGLFLTEVACLAHIYAGAKTVIQSAPAKDATPMFVYGVNHEQYSGQPIISAASCTTNCLAPLAKVIHDAFGIRRGLMSTVHATTATQNTVDGPSGKDWRGGRGVLDNIIPSSTGAAQAVGKVLPALDGKLTGMAFRVPTSDVSVVDLTVELERGTTYEEICAVVKTASESATMGETLAYTDEKVVSSDFRGVGYSSIFDSNAGVALESNFVKLVAWYDNEYGYTCNMMRLARHVSSFNARSIGLDAKRLGSGNVVPKADQDNRHHGTHCHGA